LNRLEAGRLLLRCLKATAGGSGPAVSIPVGKTVEAILRPVATRIERLNADDIVLLTEWRNRYVKSFLTEFSATEAQTSRWLSETVNRNESKILFMVDDATGRTFAYMGLDFINWENGSGEADAIVRGGEARRGLMTLALQTMLGWAQGQLGLTHLGVRVRSDNSARHFYECMGFREVNRVPLRMVREENVIRWVEDELMQASTVSLVHMVFLGSQHSDW
jgi:RimJ/RimL family protein N-acetyltransferase